MCNNNKKTSYIAGKKTSNRKICILSLRNKKKKCLSKSNYQVLGNQEVTDKKTISLFKGSEAFGFSNFI